MPIYEYQCTQCGKIEEAFQKISDAPLTTCKHCSGKLHKLISQSTFHLKGSGWYVTDYARKTKTGKTEPKDGAPAGESKSHNSESKSKD